MQGNYSVHIQDFSERHFIKSFQKKYKTQWDFTLRAIISELEHIDSLLLTNKAEIICHVGNIKIIKTKFKVAGTKESAVTSGNRCIISWHLDKRFVYVLLVYGKTDLSGSNETTQWKNLVKENYSEYSNIL